MNGPGAGDQLARPVDDARWMGEALALARGAAEAGEVPVGAVVVCGGEALGRAANAIRAAGAIAHAEMRAIADAIRARGTPRLEGCTLYVTLEPCAMCAGAIVLARLDRVVFGAWDDKAGMAGSLGDLLRDPRLNHSPEVLAGIRADESAALLREFFAVRR
jgi:tRNA(adenine34) deaminase